MGKLLVVQGDAVSGTDTHTIAGFFKAGSPPPPYSGTGDYTYNGKITDGLSTFVKIGGKAVALVTSTSSLNSGETSKGGGHSPESGLPSKYVPPGPDTSTLQFVPPIKGVGVPNAAAGSALLTLGGVKVLLDTDKIDTCDGTGSANSTVTASGQSFVNCSG